MTQEVFVNLGESALAVAALSTDPTLTLLAGAPFPAVGQYRIRLDDSLQQPNGIATRYEICRATFNAGNVINGFRTGADREGTTAQAWPIGTAVRAIVTAAALANMGPSGTFASLSTGRILSPGTLPTAVAGAGAGTSPPAPSVTTGSSDTRGRITFGTGTAPAGGVLVTVTFATAYATAPIVVIAPSFGGAWTPFLDVTAVTTTTFSVGAAAAYTASQSNTTYAFNYIVIG